MQDETPKVGRPSKYTPELIEKARIYLEVLPEDEVIHSVAGLADFLDISRDTCHEWAKDEDKLEFSDIYGAIMRKQEKALANAGLTNKFNSTITKLMLSKHGYSDKVEQQTDITSKGDKITFTWDDTTDQ